MWSEGRQEPWGMPAGSLLRPSDPPDARLHALSTSGISLQLPSFALELRCLKYLLLAPKDDFLRHGKDSVAFFSSVLPFYPFLLKPFFQLYQKYSQSVFQLTPVRAWPEWALTVSSSENTVSVLDDCSLAILELASSSQPQLPSLIHSNKSTTLHDLDLIKTMMDEKK